MTHYSNLLVMVSVLVAFEHHLLRESLLAILNCKSCTLYLSILLNNDIQHHFLL